MEMMKIQVLIKKEVRTLSGNIKTVPAINYSANDTNGDDEDPSINQEESGSENLDFSTNNDARF